jgi:hypothetical protein
MQRGWQDKLARAGSMRPRPPPPPDPAGAGFSVTLDDALADSPLAVELQLMAKVNADCASRATASVTV